jgi:hypothetical protein
MNFLDNPIKLLSCPSHIQDKEETKSTSLLIIKHKLKVHTTKDIFLLYIFLQYELQYVTTSQWSTLQNKFPSNYVFITINFTFMRHITELKKY